MALNLDTYLGVHADALKLQSKRMEVIADNLANSDTPGYKARDIDFRAAMANVGGAGGASAPVKLTTTNPGHLGTDPTTEANATLKYRVPLAPALDGNTVDAQQEQAAFADNTVRYQATLTFLSSRFKSLMTAITGQ
ncbi:MAG: flgB [Gammaproteobacteria bacterium]|nr:flgB [Gammaproteobacteria bacterium]